jgi:cardiolipin synthase (CMP-forming)
MSRWLNIPNSFTLLRLALVPFIIQAIVEGRHFAALALFAVAALTDLLDGAAARHFGSSTQAGAYLDPIADKCLLSGVFLALAVASILPWWVVAIIFGRDIYILLAVAVIMLSTPVRRFPPTIWGKLATFVQIITAVAWMARDVLSNTILDAFPAAMLWPCVGFTIWSGVHYTWRGIQLAKAD